MQETEFPNFDDLPDYDSPFNFHEEKDGFLSPVRHWCLLGEIKEFIQCLRLRVSLKLRSGQVITVHFYHNNTDQPTTFSWKEIKKGRTMAILYAKQKNFLDFSVGIRQGSTWILYMCLMLPSILCIRQLHGSSIMKRRRSVGSHTKLPRIQKAASSDVPVARLLFTVARSIKHQTGCTTSTSVHRFWFLLN